MASAVGVSGVITRIVSSPAMVPTTSGHSSLSSATATELACPGEVFSTTRFCARSTSLQKLAGEHARSRGRSPRAPSPDSLRAS